MVSCSSMSIWHLLPLIVFSLNRFLRFFLVFPKCFQPGVSDGQGKDTISEIKSFFLRRTKILLFMSVITIFPLIKCGLFCLRCSHLTFSTSLCSLSDRVRLVNASNDISGEFFLNSLCFLFTDLLQYFSKYFLGFTFKETMIRLSIASNS